MPSLPTAEIIVGDAKDMLKALPSESVDCCVTSPPYWRLRDYGHPGQLGHESSPDEFAGKLVAVFAEVKRVLRPQGTLWLNLGDTYVGSGGGRPGDLTGNSKPLPKGTCTLLRKNLAGIPWRVALALQAAGWILRSDIIWHKPGVMPEAVRDRPTKCHEYLFLLVKSSHYYYDRDAVREPYRYPKPLSRPLGWDTVRYRAPKEGAGSKPRTGRHPQGRNRRTVWTIPTESYKGKHFATFPRALAEPCILAGCPEGGTVLDPFAGSGTTLEVAARLGRNSVGIELNGQYVDLIEERFRLRSGNDNKNLAVLLDSVPDRTHPSRKCIHKLLPPLRPDC